MLMRRLHPFHLLAAVAVAVLAYAVWWYSALGAFKQQMAGLARTGQPLQVRARTISYGGFPYRHEALFSDVEITRARSDYQFSIRAAHLRVTHTAWSQGFFIGEMDRLRLALAVPALQSELGTVAATATAAQFSLKLRGGTVERLSLLLEQATSTLPGRALPVNARHLELHGRERSGGVPTTVSGAATLPALLDISVSGTGVALAGGRFGLASTWAVTGVPRRDTTGADIGVGTLEQWRAGGGTLELTGLTLLRGADVDTTAAATLALDARGQVTGAGTLASACLARVYSIFGTSVPATPLPRCGTVRHDAAFQIAAGKVELVLK